MASLTVPHRVLLALSILLAGTASTGLAATEPQESFGESTSVVLVEVPVQVVDDDGNPVRGLKAENFVIQDGKKEREITDFEVIDRGAPGVAKTAAVEIPPAGRRHFLFLFDLSFASPTSILKARGAAKSVLAHLHPSDLAAVATFSLMKGNNIVLPFTTDHQQIEVAMDSLGSPKIIDRSPDPLGLMMKLFPEAESVNPTASRSGDSDGPGGGGGAGASKYEGLVREMLAEQEKASGRANRDVQTNRVKGLVQGMGNLAGLMRSVDGRKYVIYLSEGFDSKLLTGEGNADETQASIESGEVWNVDSDQMYGSGRLQNVLQKMIDEFRRADCTVQAVDIGGLRGEGEGEIPGGQDGLFAMAKGTGGDLYRNFNDLGQALDRLLQKTSVTYLLAFQPDDLTTDGGYHQIKVKLRDAPSGARIVHRPGYFAPKPGTSVTPAERRLDIAGEVLAGKVGGDIGLSVLAVPFRGAAGATAASVPVLIEMDGNGLLGYLKSGSVPAEVYAYALDEQGGVVDYLYQTLSLDVAKVGERVRQGGIKLYGHLNLPAGSYTLRVLVRNSSTSQRGIAAVPVVVPAFNPGELAVLPPLIPELSFDRWLMVRQPAKEGETEPPYPFVLGAEESFVPAALPVVTGGKAVPLGIFAYNLPPNEVGLTAQLINERGDVVQGRQLQVLQRYESTDGGPSRLKTALEVDGVPAGRYTLKVLVSNGQGGPRSLASLPVEVLAGTGSGGNGTVAEVFDSSGGGILTTEDSAPRVPSEKDSVRAAALGHAYQDVLTLLGSGRERDAVALLAQGELAEAKATEDVLLKVLHDSEIDIARQLARQDPEALIPVMLLHENAYQLYRQQDARLLNRHSRVMVEELAQLYVDQGGKPTELAATVFASLGGSLQQAGLTASANSLFERALDLDKNNEGALLALAVYSEKIGDYAHAVPYLEKLIAAHPQDSEAWLRLGINQRRLANPGPAAGWLTKSLSTDAEPWVRSIAYQELAAAAITDGDLVNAEKLLRQGVDQFPRDQRLRLQLANLLDRRGKAREASLVLEDLAANEATDIDFPRYQYNRWPTQVLESSRLQLANTATSRLPVLARVISGLAKTEWAR